MEPTPAPSPLVQRHLKLGWWSLLLFLTLGIALELMHGFKLDLYLNVTNETRRLMWRLAHAHGALIAIVHVVFAASLKISAAGEAGWAKTASRFLTAGGLLLPLGFFLGGLFVYGGDPWLGVLLVPVGAFFFFLAVLVTAKNV